MTGYHALQASEVVRSLGSSDNGLTPQEAETRLKRFGLNELREEDRTTALRIFARQFSSFLTVILIAAGAISFLLGETMDAIAIASIIILNAILRFIQEYRAERALEALKRLAAPHAKVLREGQERIVESKEVVPGDIVLLEAGDQAPADARLLQVVNLKADESPLTGESVPSVKFVEALPEEIALADRENMVYAGTAVNYGRGQAVVVATGMETQFGQIAVAHTQVEDSLH